MAFNDKFNDNLDVMFKEPTLTAEMEKAATKAVFMSDVRYDPNKADKIGKLIQQFDFKKLKSHEIEDIRIF